MTTHDDPTGSAGVPPAPRHDVAKRRSRGYLPHLDSPGSIQMVTFRLADALPAAVAAPSKRSGILPPRGTALARQGDATDQAKDIEAALDAGHGSCLLSDSRVAGIVEDALLSFDGTRYRLIAWVIMPNHVHALVEIFPTQPLSAIVHSWKSFTAHACNRALGRTGPFWQREYNERAIRDERHLASAIEYVHRNPCKAGLVDSPELWEFGSAGHYARGAGETPALPDGNVRIRIAAQEPGESHAYH